MECSITANGRRLCVRAGLLARMFKVSTAPRLTQNRCYAYVWRIINRETQFENETDKIKNRSDGKKS